MIFLAAGFYQILESSALLGGAQYSFQKAVYYAAITVIGRPGVPFVSTLTPVFLTVAALMSATIIPTFVAELIRVWYDNATLETYAGAPDLRHVIVCGDTNVSRLRALADQYLHKARDPDTVTPLVVMGDAKPEGALRVFVDQYKHSGQVVYIRGSARRAADLRRAGLARAKCVIVLNYRSDKDAAAADTEALSTVMAVKNARPEIRVLAQLQVRGRSRRRRTGCSCRATAEGPTGALLSPAQRPRKRNHLKVVPGWRDDDKSIAGLALAMTLVGLGTHVPAFPTLIINLVRHGAQLGGVQSAIAAKALPWWQVILYGDRARPAAKEAAEDLLRMLGELGLLLPGR